MRFLVTCSGNEGIRIFSFLTHFSSLWSPWAAFIVLCWLCQRHHPSSSFRERASISAASTTTCPEEVQSPHIETLDQSFILYGRKLFNSRHVSVQSIAHSTYIWINNHTQTQQTDTCQYKRFVKCNMSWVCDTRVSISLLWPHTISQTLKQLSLPHRIGSECLSNVCSVLV